MARVGSNIVANILGKVWIVLVSLLVVPVYLKLLGIEAYGLIGVLLTLMAIAPLFDFGLCQAFTRALARHSAGEGEAAEARDLLRTYEIVYWVLGIAIGAVLVALAPVLAGHWIKPQALSRAEVEQALALAGVTVACLWPRALYSSGVIGMQRQVALNVLSSTMSTISNLGGIVVVWQAGTVQSLFAWFAVVGLVESVLTRVLLSRLLPHAERHGRFDPAVLTRSGRFAAGMASISVLAVILTQLDKVILSSVLSLEQFAYYSLAWRLASALQLIVGPLSNVFFPRFSQLALQRSESELVRVYHASCQVLSVLVIPAAVVIAVFPRELLLLWTHDPAIAGNAAMVLGLLAIGTGLGGLMALPNVLQIAYGSTRLIMIGSAVGAVLLAPLMYFAAIRYGAVGAAAAWIALNGGYILLLLRYMHRAVLPNELRAWFFVDVGPPLAASAATAVAWKLAFPQPESYIAVLVEVAAGSALTLLAAAIVAPHVRSIVATVLSRGARAA